MSQGGAEPALFALVKDALDGMGALVAAHVKLARAELTQDARAYARRGALAALAAVVLLLGYALSCVAGALALGRVIQPPLAFLAVGGFNLVSAGICLAVVLRRAPVHPLDESLSELNRTVARLAPERKQLHEIA